MILYRPVGLQELHLVAEIDYKRFPARLPSQPIFYPVLKFSYAEQIARDWNTKDPASGYAGFVLQFEVDDQYIKRFPVHTVGNQDHQELWVPAEELDEFNRHILGEISVEASFYGENFEKGL
jgi:hypothetical protein